MKKILFPYYPFANGGYPAQYISDGMVMASEHQINALVEAGYDVTLLTSKNFPVNTSKVKHIKGNFLSKEDGGQMKWKEFTESIIEHAKKYDLIWLNSPEIRITNNKLKEQLKPYVSKIVLVLHHYDDVPFSSFLVTMYQTMAWVLENGGRVATVSKTFSEYAKKLFTAKPGVIFKNPYHCPDLPVNFVNKFEWSNILVVDDLAQGELDSNGDFVVLGRCSEEKKLHVAVQSFVQSGVQGRLHVITNEPVLERKKQVYYDKLKKLSNDKVIWHVGASRSEIFKVLRKSSVLIFPSSKETFGLSAFEASSCGCKIIYGCPNVWFLSDYDIKVENFRLNTFVKAIQSVQIPTVEEKEMVRKKWQKQGSLTAYADRIREFIEID